MTRSTNARIAGFTFLFYIAVAFPAVVLLNRAASGAGTAAKLASVAQHATDVRVAIDAPDSAGAQALGAFLLAPSPPHGATFFAVGSTFFSYLLLRGRMIPVALAWLGVAAPKPRLGMV